eukprot:2884209-Amphidinium_carterae.1
MTRRLPYQHQRTESNDLLRVQATTNNDLERVKTTDYIQCNIETTFNVPLTTVLHKIIETKFNIRQKLDDHTQNVVCWAKATHNTSIKTTSTQQPHTHDHYRTS